jgi:AcrR family transcriptional regulator
VARRTRAEQRLETRRTLVAQARRLFARHGYAAVSLADITSAAAVTKGAFYHNFTSKADLFREIVEQVQHEVADRVAAAADVHQDPWEQLLAGCRTFLAVSRDPEVQQIMLIDGPSVLGWNQWRAMDEASSARHLTEALTTLIDNGTIPDQPVEPLTRLLSGAMNEAALWLARSTDPGDLPAVTMALTRMLRSLRDQPP